MKHNGNKDALTFENPDLVAFIKINQNITPRPFLRPDGKVLFAFDTDVTQSLEDFKNNKPVGVKDLLTEIRLTRSFMYSYKQGENGR